MGKRVQVKFHPRTGIVASRLDAWGSIFDLLLQGPQEFREEGSYAIVDICGPLSHKPSPDAADDYGSILSRCKAALESDCKSLCLVVDSPGGDFAGSIETATCIRKLADKYGKRVIAFTDSRALSAGYALCMAADEIVVTPSAFVGSIGVWAPLVDETAADKARGVVIRIVPSGSKKAARNSHVGITDETVEDLQTEVNAMADLFFKSVSENRTLSEEKVKALQGGETFGEAAVQAGLADRCVLSWDAFISGQATATGDNMSKSAEKPFMKALRAAAEEGDEDAKRALKAADYDVAEEEKAKKKAEEEDEKEKKAKAKKEEEEKAKAEKEEEEKMAKAKASGNEAVIALTKELHAMKVAMAEDKERSTLLATRPDFSETVRNTLASAPLNVVREACKNWPVASTSINPVLASEPTRGDTQTNKGHALNEDDKSYIKSRMSRSGHTTSSPTNTYRGGREVEFNALTPEQAQALLDKAGK